MHRPVIKSHPSGVAISIFLIDNLGIRGAAQCGYMYALKNECDIAIQMDGDGQHSYKDLENLILEMIENKYDMVIGSRFIEKTDYKPSLPREIGIKYFSKLVSLLCKKNYYDTTSGYRLVNKKGIKLFVDYYPRDYPEVETIVYACKTGLKVKEVKVEMCERMGGKSSINFIDAMYYMVKVTISTILIGLRSYDLAMLNLRSE